MQIPIQIRSAVESEIRNAFRGVTLELGMSLRQAQFADSARQGNPVTIASGEITDDWSRVPLEELERDCVALLDALGFRYYIPALMLSLLDHYDSSSMRVIGTLGALYPKKDNLWEHHMYHYSLLSPAQKIAIAGFLETLPKLVQLDGEDQKVVARSLRNYWGQFLRATGTSS